MAQHLAFEVDSLHFSLARLAVLDEASPQPEPQECNAFIEGGYLHARNLVECFLDDPYKDDLVASDYVSDWSVANDGGAELAWLRDEVAPVLHKRLAHLTLHRHRVRQSDDIPIPAAVGAALDAVLDRFLGRLTPERRAWLLGYP